MRFSALSALISLTGFVSLAAAQGITTYDVCSLGSGFYHLLPDFVFLDLLLP